MQDATTSPNGVARNGISEDRVQLGDLHAKVAAVVAEFGIDTVMTMLSAAPLLAKLSPRGPMRIAIDAITDNHDGTLVIRIPGLPGEPPDGPDERRHDVCQRKGHLLALHGHRPLQRRRRFHRWHRHPQHCRHPHQDPGNPLSVAPRHPSSCGKVSAGATVHRGRDRIVSFTITGSGGSKARCADGPIKKLRSTQATCKLSGGALSPGDSPYLIVAT
jgi:hypothetical protein